ncbi:MAG: polyhydroxyalkanoic acid system family protein [Candidatus Kapabacteria bacterium]|nr:polyhydroxyalkanoic acid system family protein [Candidatus Kapabacteria bacterium]
MSRIQKKFQTQATAIEMKNFINNNLLNNSALKALLDSAIWIENTLHVQSKLGKGTISLQDYLIEIDIELSLFGKVAQKSLESAIDKELKLLK